MIRISRLTDYGIVLLSHMALGSESQNAKELAASVRLPEPTVGKLLKVLTRGGILSSHRGARGGYTLSRPPEAITVGEVIAAIDGPIAITDCSGEDADRCTHEPSCPVRANWQRINLAIRDSLDGITLAEMARPASVNLVRLTEVKVRPAAHRAAVTAEVSQLCQS